MKVCLLTAGMGTRMGKYSGIINKSLLPYDGKAIISHIIDNFPRDTTEFVVAVGYKAEQVMTYLKMAHPECNFQFVVVGDYEKNGPAWSVLSCAEFLQEPFLLFACDGLYSKNIKDYANISESYLFDAFKPNYVFTKFVAATKTKEYCTFVTAANLGPPARNDRIIEVYDKVDRPTGAAAATGAYLIYDYTSFLDGLIGKTELSEGYSKLTKYSKEIDWVDLGTEERYESSIKFQQGSSFDYSKNDEFIYFINDKVIKFFADSKIAKNRVARANKSNTDSFPELVYHDQFYCYNYVEGKTLYQDSSVDTFMEFVEWMKWNLWMEPAEKLRLGEMFSFYVDKTLDRVEMFKEKYPDFNPEYINGSKIDSDIHNLLGKMPWLKICDLRDGTRNKIIHGDLQFDNIVVSYGMKFTLIDWRQDFAGRTDVGDWYYDLAKLIGGMLVNYDYIKAGMFSITEVSGDVEYNFDTRYNGAAKYQYLRQSIDLDDDQWVVIDMIVTLIYLNMAPLHHAPYDKMLYCLALERLNAHIHT